MQKNLNLLLILIFLISTGTVFAEETALATFIKEKNQLTAENKNEQQKYVRNFSIKNVELQEETIYITVQATLEDYYSYSDFGHGGVLKLFKAGQFLSDPQVKVLNRTEDPNAENGGAKVTVTEGEYLFSDNLQDVKGIVSYDIAAMYYSVNTSGYIYHWLISYDNLIITKKGSKIDVQGFTPPEEEKTGQKSKVTVIESKPKRSFPGFIYPLFSKIEELQQTIKEKKEQVRQRLKAVLENIVISTVAGESPVAALKQELAGIMDVIKSDSETGENLEKLFSRQWDLETRVDFKAKDLFLSAVDTFAAKGGLGPLDAALTTLLSKNPESRSYLRELIMDKDELEYNAMQQTKSELEISEIEALAYNDLIKKPERTLTDKVTSFIPFATMISKGVAKTTKKVANLVGFIEDKAESDEQQVAKWAGESYMFTATVVANKMLDGATREEALNSARQEFFKSELCTNDEFIRRTNGKKPEEFFKGVVKMLEKNGTFKKLETYQG